MANEGALVKWLNSKLRGHLKTTKKKLVTDLAVDLQDGIILGELVENVAKMKIGYQKNERLLKFKPQKLENLGTSFRYLAKANIKLVNIGPEDIYNGNKKLTLGLIWTLIRRYQIRSTGRALSTKESMLAWVNTQIPDHKISNFTTDWSDGVAICALVDKIQPGLIPHHATLSPADKLANCMLGMGLAEDKLDIPKILAPDELCHPDVDEISVMTYISYFCDPANAHLLKWVQSAIPECNIQNFTKDWNNGVNFAHLLEAINEGGFPDCKYLDPSKGIDNLTRCMAAAEDQLGIKPLLTPKQMADPSVDELNIVTYLSRFQNAKPIPKPTAVSCSGDGLRKAILHREATFEVDTLKGGAGELEVEIECDGKPLDTEVSSNFGSPGVKTVKYKSDMAEPVTISIKWSGTEVPSSPYTAHVIDPKTVSLSMTGNKLAKIGEIVRMEANGVTDLADLEVSIELSNGHIEEAKLVTVSKGVIECSYTAQIAGIDKVTGKIAGIIITDCPFEIKVVDPTLLNTITLRNPASDVEVFADSSIASHLVNTPFELSAVTTNAGPGNIVVAGEAPDKSPLRVFTHDEDDDCEKATYLKFDPSSVGDYTLSISWGSEPLNGSPFTVKVVDPANCQLSSEFPSCIQKSNEVSFEIDAKEAGEGEITVTSKGPEVEATVAEKAPGVYAVTLLGAQVGTTPVDVQFGKYSMPQAPFTVNVCDASKCSCDLTSGVYNINSPIKFNVNSEGAGQAKLQIVPSKPAHIDVQDADEDEIWKVELTPKEIGEYSLQILWGGIEIPGRPFTFSVCNPGKVKVIGVPKPDDVLLIGEEITFTVDSSEAGPGTLVCHTICGDEEKGDVAQEETDSEMVGITSLQFIPKSPGKIQLVVEFNGVDVLLKPHFYDVPDPSKFKVVPPQELCKINEELKFKIIGVSEGKELAITATHPEDKPTVTLEQEQDSSTAVARITPTQRGDYEVEVKHTGQHVDGSPFVIQVCDPSACRFSGQVPSVIHVGEVPNIQIDSSEAGPGALTFESEILAGATSASTENEEDEGWVLSLTDGVGKVRVTAKWGGYNIPNSPFILSIVDSEEVSWSCDMLDEKDTLEQGDLLKIFVDGKDAGEVVPEVVAKGPDGEEYAAKIADNEDGTYMVTLTPWHIGKNEVTVLWGGKAIPDMPILFDVLKSIDTKAITVAGEGLTQAIAGEEAVIFVNAIEPGLLKQGTLSIKIEGDQEGDEGEDEDLPTTDVSDEGDGKYKLTFVAPKEGKYNLKVLFKDNHVADTPCDVLVKAAPDAGKCKVFGEAMEKQTFISGAPLKFSVDTSEAGSGALTFSATQPDGDPTEVYTLEDGDVHNLKFDPTTVGHHKMTVKWGDEDVPGSPFDFNVIDPSKCLVEDLPKTAEIEEEMNFTVTTIDAGECVPKVTVAKSEEESIELEGSEAPDGVFSYDYTPQTFGTTNIEVTVADAHVPGSPFKLNVHDPNSLSITKLNLTGDYAIVCEPVSITIEGKNDEEILVTAHGPSADLSVETKQTDEEVHEASFVPIEPGSYEVFVECSGLQIHGSPLSIKVADPSKCQLLGGAPSVVHVGKSGEVTVKTRGAGEGKLEAFVNHPDNSSPSLECKVQDIGLDTYTLKLCGKKIGKATIDLQWAGFTIPNSPYLLNVCDATKCKAYGEILELKEGKAGTPIAIKVETAEAGDGELEVVAKGPSAQYNVTISKTEDNTYEATFTPWEVGEHSINVLWAKERIPESPFAVTIGSPLEMGICNASGDGLKRAIAGQKAVFTIICSEVGLLDKNTLAVSIAGVTSQAEVVIMDNNNGVYTVEYVPPSPGAYVASIQFHGRQIPGSPFKVTVDSGPDASKCKAYGPALHPNTLAIAGSPLEFFVDSSQAGFGQLRVYIQGPHDYKPKVFIADDEKGIHSIKFDAMKSGKYFVVVCWSDQHIPNSPFRIRVHPAANAGKVKAYGPGLLDGFIGTPGQFTVETKNAGIGTLLIRIHGLKDSFKTEAKPISPEDVRTLIVTYSPKLVGEYTIFVRWSGVHVPGSPFVVKIKQKPGESDPSVEPVRSKKKVASPEKKMIEAGNQKRQKRPISTTSSRESSRSGLLSSSPKRNPQAVMKKSPPGGAVPMPSSMKMMDNPAMAMSLQQYSLPPGYHQAGGYVDPRDREGTYVQPPKVVKKVIKKRVVKKRSSGSREGRSATPGRALSPQRGKVTSPSRTGRAMSPEARKPAAAKAASPVRKTSPPPMSPERKISGTRQSTSPERKISGTSQTRQPTSPERKISGTSQTRQSTSPERKISSSSQPRGMSPTSGAMPPTRRAASPATSPIRQAASPGRSSASPGGKAVSPAPKAGAKKKKRVAKKVARAKSPPPKKGKELPPKKAAMPRR